MRYFCLSIIPTRKTRSMLWGRRRRGQTPFCRAQAASGEGFCYQASWLFASKFRSMGHRQGQYPKHLVRLWKVQRTFTG